MGSGDVTVKFSAELSAPLTDTDIRGCVILSADNLTGTSRKWFQSDYYSGMTEEEFIDGADASWWPYMKFRCEYPSTKVSPTDRGFKDVAMGIYPDYNGEGCVFSSDWNGNRRETASISFSMPMQQEYDGFGVQNTSETAVTVILLNGNNGEVIAASQVKASDYNRDLTDVKSIDVRELPTIKSYEDGISVCSQSEAYVRIFTVDGRMHYSGRIEAGESFIEVKEKGLVVVDVDGSFFKILK